MKKALFIIISIVALIAATIIGIGVYVANTPEYALKEMIDDVNTSGMDGLIPILPAEQEQRLMPFLRLQRTTSSIPLSALLARVNMWVF